jgi:curved DNA-binding protein CbpA
MNDDFFWRELGLEPGAARKQIKKAYWQLARKNHPDFFPDDRKPVQELKMIALNAAYAYLMGTFREEVDYGAGGHGAGDHGAGDHGAGDTASSFAPGGAAAWHSSTGAAAAGQSGTGGGLRFDTSWSGPGATGVAEPASDRTDLGFHKDPSYAYYKQGFVHFSRAIHGIEALYQSLSQRRVVHFKPRDDAYQRFTDGLIELRRAHEYFSRVVQEFEGSIWKHDARMKLRRIERFTGLYRRILGNLTRAG